MIPITPEIIGPGIEEEYADALAAIAGLREALGPRTLTNDTPEGRVSLEILWLEQEISRQRLPIPVDRSYAGTVYYLTGSGELNHIPNPRVPETEQALTRLYIVLQGIGLLKARHVPVVKSTIDDLTADARLHWNELTTAERAIVEDLEAQSNLLGDGGWPAYRRPGQRFGSSDTPNLDALIERYFYRIRDVETSLFDGWRPIAARKPPLPAPVPGLAPQAPPLPDNLKSQIP